MNQTKTEILAVIDNVIRLKRDTLGPSLLSRLNDELTRVNPKFHQMERMKWNNPRKFQHVTMPSKIIRSITMDDETVYIPRGCKPLVSRLAEQHDFTIKWIDKRVYFDRDPGMEMVDGFTLLPYQASSMAVPIISEGGVLEMPCGGGKTVLGIAIAVTLAQPTMVVVHTTDLLQQWVGELADKAVIPGGVGVVGGGKKSARYVTVATVQTLTRMGRAELLQLLGKFGCFILDECHHCPADTFLGIMNLSKGRYRYGFTATKERKDGLHFLMHDVLGPIVATVTDTDLKAVGRSQDVIVINVDTPFYTDYTAGEWTKLITALTSDENRNRLIVDNIVNSWKDGHFPLVLSDRVSHCKQLHRMLQTHGVNSQLLVGDVPKQRRYQIMTAARENLIDVIVATQVADEGLDIPTLTCLHLTVPTANKGRLQQRIGRIRRPKDKPSVLYDYTDSRVSSCARMYRERRRLYNEWGFTYLNSNG